MKDYLYYKTAVVKHVPTSIYYLRISYNNDKDYLLMLGRFDYRNVAISPIIIIDKTREDLNAVKRIEKLMTENVVNSHDNGSLNNNQSKIDDKYSRFKINIGYDKNGKPIYHLQDNWNGQTVTLDTPNHQHLFRVVSTDPIALYEVALMYFKVHA